jgi:hypothetical protein
MPYKKLTGVYDDSSTYRYVYKFTVHDPKHILRKLHETGAGTKIANELNRLLKESPMASPMDNLVFTYDGYFQDQNRRIILNFHPSPSSKKDYKDYYTGDVDFRFKDYKILYYIDDALNTVLNDTLPYETIVIPKGTVLFRGINSTAAITSDFAGMLKGEKFCLHENYNVFFYPFPFISNTVATYPYMAIYVTMRDLKLINLVLPSKFNRGHGNAETGGIVACNNIKLGCNNTQGRDYDPCIDYRQVPNDISGMVAIANADANKLKTDRIGKQITQQYGNKYFTTYKDARNIVGVPEFILHPLADKTERTEAIPDFKPWYHANKGNFNYNYLHVMSNDYKPIQDLMDTFMSEGGLDLGDSQPYHLKMNKKNGLFQIVEFSNNHDDLIAPDFSIQTTELIRSPLTGASRSLRRATLRKRKSR